MNKRAREFSEFKRKSIISGPNTILKKKSFFFNGLKPKNKTRPFKSESKRNSVDIKEEKRKKSRMAIALKKEHVIVAKYQKKNKKNETQKYFGNLTVRIKDENSQIKKCIAYKEKSNESG
jgi:hypothetical protein